MQPEAPVQTPVTPPATEQPAANDPLEWAKKKGLDTPEAAVRALQKLEEEFHRRNQAGHPGYRDLGNGNPAPQPQVPPAPQWTPQPQVPAFQPPYGYPPPPPPNRADINQSLARKYGMDPEDVERLMPMMLDAADAIATRKTAALERHVMNVTRQTERNAEFQTLMQDPAFLDPRVRAEMHEVLKDGQLFQQGGRAYTTAFNMALANLARKQLQQGVAPEVRPSNMPPVTAGGGNGSANTAPFKVTEAIFNTWTDEQQEAFLTKGAIPKR